MRIEAMLEGLCFPEGPRWHEGRLYFSDMHAHWVMAVDEAGRAEKIIEVPNQPSGLGWRPDGTMLVVSMVDRTLMAARGGTLERVADLSRVATFHCNDMVVDVQGRAYVGNFGFDLFDPNLTMTPEALAGLPKAALARVDPDGSVHVAARDLAFPNGTVITPDGRTLIVAESIGQRLTAFDIGADGALLNRRVWAETPRVAPDGICLDEAGGYLGGRRARHRVHPLREGRPRDAPRAGRRGATFLRLHAGRQGRAHAFRLHVADQPPGGSQDAQIRPDRPDDGALCEGG